MYTLLITGMDINLGGRPVPLRALRCPGMVRVGDLVLLLSTPLPILDLPPTPPPPPPPPPGDNDDDEDVVVSRSIARPSGDT